MYILEDRSFGQAEIESFLLRWYLYLLFISRLSVVLSFWSGLHRA